MKTWQMFIEAKRSVPSLDMENKSPEELELLASDLKVKYEKDLALSKHMVRHSNVNKIFPGQFDPDILYFVATIAINLAKYKRSQLAYADAIKYNIVQFSKSLPNEVIPLLGISFLR